MQSAALAEAGVSASGMECIDKRGAFDAVRVRLIGGPTATNVAEAPYCCTPYQQLPSGVGPLGVGTDDPPAEGRAARGPRVRGYAACLTCYTNGNTLLTASLRHCAKTAALQPRNVCCSPWAEQQSLLGQQLPH